MPPGRPFLTALAEALLSGNLPIPGGAPPGPLQLADTTLLLPTRRATRALQEVAVGLLHDHLRTCVTGAARSSNANGDARLSD